MYDIIREELEGPSIFRDESKLFPDYVPERLPHREEHLRRLARLFRVLIDRPGAVSQKVILTGHVGTGKTAVSKRFGADFERYARERGVNLRYVHINCHRDRTLFLVVQRLAEAVSTGIPSRGLSPQEMINVLKQVLEDRDMYLLVALDEADFLIRTSGGDVLYDLIRISEEEIERRPRLSYIIIMRDLSILEMLDESITSSLMHNIIKFEPYTSGQIFDIVKDRAREAFYPGVVDDEVLKLIADITGADASGSGDARYALELLWRAGKYAEQEGARRVTTDHVRRAKRDTHPALRMDVIEELSKHERLLLLAIARSLKKTEKASVPLGVVEKEYHVVCEEWNERPRKHTQVWEYVRNLKHLGIITARVSGPGYRGRTTLIGLHDVPTDVLERTITELLRRGERARRAHDR